MNLMHGISQGYSTLTQRREFETSSVPDDAVGGRGVKGKKV